MPDPSTRQAFAESLVAEFAAAIESVLGTTVGHKPASFAEGTGWMVRITLSGTLSGAVAIWIGDEDAAMLAQRVVGDDAPADSATIIDMLGEMWGQAASAVGLKDPFVGVKAVVTRPEAGAPDRDGIAAYQIDLGEGAVVQLSIAGEVTAATVAVAVAPKSTALTTPEPAGDPNARLELVLDIDLPLVVRFGRTLMSIKALADLGPGSIVDMGRSPDEPVEMLIGDRVIARGEVVVVAGNYGVRIMDLVSSVERIRAVGR